MNLLIVDDNKNNRMILSLLLEDYMDENEGVKFSIDEAVDGVEAVRMCDEKEYSIVLMDIMMPNMDGIEATKILRQKHKKMMIIAVSAVDDNARQKEILSNGAEDYISKPVNSDIFTTRISNYVHLINSRVNTKETPSVNEMGVNVFTKEIFNRYTNFRLSSEDALSELWEYYLLDAENKCENLSDVVRTVFSVGEVQLRLKIKGNLFVEESEDFKYFTITNIGDIPAAVISLLIKKNEIHCEYKILDNKISFKLQKIEEEMEICVVPVIQNTVVAKEIVPEVAPKSEINYVSADLEVFDYIDTDDMIDLEEYANRLTSLMLLVGSGDVSEEDVFEIYTYIEKLGSILATYTEVYVMANALSELAADMSTHTAEFIENSEALGPMCSAFGKDIANWIEQSFHTGAPSVDFMNDTIVVNCQTIAGMLKMNEEPADGADDFDDIFDF